MNDLTNALYEFVTARRMGRVFDDPEYHSITASAQNKETRLRELLDRDGNRLLTDLMNEQTLQNAIELETMFQATAVSWGRWCSRHGRIISAPTESS
mgnify:CR=1 FL=1